MTKLVWVETSKHTCSIFSKVFKMTIRKQSQAPEFKKLLCRRVLKSDQIFKFSNRIWITMWEFYNLNCLCESNKDRNERDTEKQEEQTLERKNYQTKQILLCRMFFDLFVFVTIGLNYFFKLLFSSTLFCSRDWVV